MTWLALAALFLLAYGLRVLPQWKSPGGAGVDHWFWLKYIETYRRERRFPPRLPQYVLDEEQWYPPLFPLLLAHVPRILFERFGGQLAIVVDLARMALLVAVAAWQSDSHPGVMLVAAAIYATTPIQISYNIQLNPRGLAAILLDGLLIVLLLAYASGDWRAWGGAALLGGIILLTHKMTTQVLVFLLLGSAIIYRRWEFLAVLPVAVAAAFILSRGFYWKVLVAHWDIVRFWARHWPWLGADPIRESPIYGDGTYERPAKLHRSGAGGFVRRSVMLMGFNPAAWISCVLVYERLFMESALIYPTPVLVWILLVLAFALLTTFVPVAKCLGAGYLYVANTSLLAPLVLALTFEYTRVPELSTPFVLLALVLNMAGLGVYYRQFFRSNRMRVDESLERIVGDLRDAPPGLVMCIPTIWAEVVAYKTGHPVLWGGHGYGFRRLEPTFPRLLKPIRAIIEEYGVEYLLTSESSLTEEFAADLPPGRLHAQYGEYRLYCFTA